MKINNNIKSARFDFEKMNRYRCDDVRVAETVRIMNNVYMVFGRRRKRRANESNKRLAI